MAHNIPDMDNLDWLDNRDKPVIVVVEHIHLILLLVCLWIGIRNGSTTGMADYMADIVDSVHTTDLLCIWCIWYRSLRVVRIPVQEVNPDKPVAPDYRDSTPFFCWVVRWWSLSAFLL